MAVGTVAAEAKIIIFNRTDRPIWVTVYGSVGKIADAFCMTAGQSKVYDGSSWIDELGATGKPMYVRGELKAGNGCGGKTFSDTGRGSTIFPGKNTVKFFEVGGGSLYFR